MRLLYEHAHALAPLIPVCAFTVKWGDFDKIFGLKLSAFQLLSYRLLITGLS